MYICHIDYHVTPSGLVLIYNTFSCLWEIIDTFAYLCVPGYIPVFQAGEASQVETVSDENKGLIWGLLKQLRPGMDLSKVVLPTFILEPRSFLDKLSDYYYHADLLSQSVTYSFYLLNVFVFSIIIDHR